MSLENIKPNKGFTIVELLIVVVVIAILAAITIVSYNGITNKANASSAQSTAATVQKKIELYNSTVGNYPISKANLTAANNSYTLDTGMFGASDPTPSTAATKGTGYVRVNACSTGTLSASTVRGAEVIWYDYEKSSSQLTTITLGDCSNSPSTLTRTGLS